MLFVCICSHGMLAFGMYYALRVVHLCGIKMQVPFHATNTMVDWSQKGSAHPKSFESSEITSHLIAHELRSNSNCPISVQGQKDVQGLSKRAFVNLAQWNMGDGKMYVM